MLAGGSWQEQVNNETTKTIVIQLSNNGHTIAIKTTGWQSMTTEWLLNDYWMTTEWLLYDYWITTEWLLYDHELETRNFFKPKTKTRN